MRGVTTAARTPADVESLALIVRAYGIRHQQIARRLGVNRSTVTRWLGGTIAIRQRDLARVAAAIAAERQRAVGGRQ